jgi:hypothetical protein
MFYYLVTFDGSDWLDFHRFDLNEAAILLTHQQGRPFILNLSKIA